MTFPIKIYFEKPKDHDINKRIWWERTDNFFKWFQWLFFIAILEAAFERTHNIFMRVVEVILVVLVFKTTLSFLPVIRIDVYGVKKEGYTYYSISLVVTIIMSIVFNYLGWKVANSVFSAFVDFQKVH